MVTLGSALTTRVTGMLSGLFPAWAEVIEMEPVYLPLDKPDGDTETVRVCGVGPAGDDTDSQLPPEVTVAVKVSWLSGAPLLVMVSD